MYPLLPTEGENSIIELGAIQIKLNDRESECERENAKSNFTSICMKDTF